MCCCLDCSLSDTCVQSLDHACTTRHNIGNENGIMAKHGSLKEFNHAKGDGKSYSEWAIASIFWPMTSLTKINNKPFSSVAVETPLTGRSKTWCHLRLPVKRHLQSSRRKWRTSSPHPRRSSNVFDSTPEFAVHTGMWSRTSPSWSNWRDIATLAAKRDWTRWYEIA